MSSSSLIGLEGCVAVASGGADVADAVIADGEIALPFGVVGVARRERFRMSSSSLKALRAASRSPRAALMSPILLYLTERSRCHSALLGSRAASRFAMSSPSLIGFEGCVAVASGGADVADHGHSRRRDRAAIRRCWDRAPRAALRCRVVVEGFEGCVAVASGGADVADLVIADGEIALPFGVVGVARREPPLQCRVRR